MTMTINYSLTEHGKKRAAQRGLGEEVINFLMMFGEVREQKGGAYLLSIPDRDRKRLQQQLKRLVRTLGKSQPPMIVMGDEGRVVTVAREYQTQRFNH